MRSFVTSIFDLAEYFAPAPSGLLSLPGPKQKQRGLRGRDSCRALGNLLGLKRQRSELRAGRTAGPTSQRQRRHREVSPRLALVFLLRHLLLNCAGQEDKEGKVTEEKSGDFSSLTVLGRQKLESSAHQGGSSPGKISKSVVTSRRSDQGADPVCKSGWSSPMGLSALPFCSLPEHRWMWRKLAVPCGRGHQKAFRHWWCSVLWSTTFTLWPSLELDANDLCSFP